MDDRDLVERAQIRRLIDEHREEYAKASRGHNFLMAEEAKTIVQVLELIIGQIDARPAGLRL